MENPHSLAKQAWLGALKFQLVLALLIFGPALSLTFWQGWLYWCVFLACVLSLTFYFLRHDPALVARRMRAGPTAEREATQKLIQLLAAIFLCATIVVSALDHLYRWSSVPWQLVVAGDLLVVAGFAVMFLVFRENTFAASTIAVESGQKVVTTGPYALVRHPMYSGALVLFFATPIALASWWGLVPAAMLAGALVWRLVTEETYLDRNLPGYPAYRRALRWRLVPGVW